MSERTCFNDSDSKQLVAWMAHVHNLASVEHDHKFFFCAKIILFQDIFLAFSQKIKNFFYVVGNLTL